jgi:hypothetical protein
MHQPAKLEISVPYLEQSLLRPAVQTAPKDGLKSDLKNVRPYPKRLPFHAFGYAI